MKLEERAALSFSFPLEEYYIIAEHGCSGNYVAVISYQLP